MSMLRWLIWWTNMPKEKRAREQRSSQLRSISVEVMAMQKPKGVSLISLSFHLQIEVGMANISLQYVWLWRGLMTLGIWNGSY